MPHQLSLLLLSLLALSGCIIPPAAPDSAAVHPEEPSPVVRQDEAYRQQLRLGLEELSRDDASHLEDLATTAPDTIWGMSALTILRLTDQLEETSDELARLRKSDKKVSHDHARLQEENLKLEKKLAELTRLLVELEKRPH